MRIAMLVAMGTLLTATACYRERMPDEGYRRVDNGYGRDGQMRAFEAQTTGGDNVLVQQDPQTGGYVIVAPESMRGTPVGMINPDTGNGTALVTLDVAPRRYRDRDRDRDRDHDRDHREGSGGDQR